jgi:hypothetical protein
MYILPYIHLYGPSHSLNPAKYQGPRVRQVTGQSGQPYTMVVPRHITIRGWSVTLRKGVYFSEQQAAGTRITHAAGEPVWRDLTTPRAPSPSRLERRPSTKTAHQSSNTIELGDILKANNKLLNTIEQPIPRMDSEWHKIVDRVCQQHMSVMRAHDHVRATDDQQLTALISCLETTKTLLETLESKLPPTMSNTRTTLNEKRNSIETVLTDYKESLYQGYRISTFDL